MLIGKNDWLFYNGEKSLEDYMGRSVLTDDDLAEWDRMLRERHDDLAARGIPYYFVVVSNKKSISPEFMPDSVVRSKITQFTRPRAFMRKKGLPPWVIDLRPALIAAKGDRPVYNQIDVHWNFYGGYVAYKAIEAALRRDGVPMRPIEVPPAAFKLGMTRKGDLVPMMGMKEYPNEVPEVTYSGTGAECVRNDGPQNGPDPTDGGPLTTAATTCDQAPDADRALEFGGSMLGALFPFLSASFNVVRYDYSYPSPDELMRAIADAHPSLVIEERVERTMIAVPWPVPPLVLTTEAPPTQRGGFISVAATDATGVTVGGWANWSTDTAGARLMVNTNLPVRQLVLTRVARPDVVKVVNDPNLLHSGFMLRIWYHDGKPLPAQVRLCLWPQDKASGLRRVLFADHQEWDRCPGE